MKKLKYTITASFQAKWVGKCREREKIKIFGPFRSSTTRNRKFKKKIVKKLKKLKNTIVDLSSQNRFERPRMRENKNYRSVPSLQDGKLKIPKK